MKKVMVCIQRSALNRCLPIRDRISLTLLLLQVVEGLSFASEIDAENPSVVQAYVAIDKMSRLFIPDSDSLHSFHFPFVIYQTGEKTEVAYRGRIIEPVFSAYIQTILNNENILLLPFEDLLDLVWSIQNEYAVLTEDERSFVYQLLLLLLTFEPGYLRYDYDPQNVIPSIHPLHHIDFYYSRNATCKFGLTRRFSVDNLIEMLDLRKDCFFLGKRQQ